MRSDLLARSRVEFVIFFFRTLEESSFYNIRVRRPFLVRSEIRLIHRVTGVVWSLFKLSLFVLEEISR